MSSIIPTAPMRLLRRRVKGGVLLYAIFLSIVIAIAFSSLFLVFYSADIEVELSQIPVDLSRNANSGINYLLTSDFNSSDTITMDLFGEGSDSVKLHQSSWGAFGLCYSKAFHKSFSNKKIALVGSNLKDAETALYIPDNGEPISIAGSTTLTGSIYISKAGIKKAYIEGKPLENPNAVKGTLHKSEKSLPEIKFQIEAASQILKKIKDANISDYSLSDSINHSFTEQTLVIGSDQFIVIDGKNLNGRILIKSQKGIEVTSNNRLHNIILFAPYIKLSNDFSGELQAIASDSISVGENVKLNYPSSILVYKEDSKSLQKIHVGKNSNIIGDIILLNDSTNSGNVITIESDVVQTGNIFTNGLVQMKGTLYGGLFSNGFYLKTSSSVYKNHLFDAEINKLKQPFFFVGCNYWDAEKRKIVSWVN
ncbi:MAG TPA: hypothetical protein PKL45_13155 [Bacteroidia bacterium]|nr:hypothetical protein [Bacteroidia bacterium]